MSQTHAPTDLDGDPLTLTIDRVTQDEPVDDPERLAPDAVLGPEPDQVQLRAERSDSGDARVNRIPPLVQWRSCGSGALAQTLVTQPCHIQERRP